MTKTAKEIILHHLKRVYFNGSTDTVARQNGVITNDTKLGETQIEVELDQALKELEAIIKSAKPADAYDVPYTDYPAGFNLAIDEYETNLLAALYGEEK